MWFTKKNILEVLCDKNISVDERQEVFEKNKKRVSREIRQLSDGELLDYLFTLKLPKGVRRFICEEFDFLSTTDEVFKNRISGIKDEFVKRKLYSEELLGVDFCPVELKKVIIDTIYEGNLVDAIYKRGISTAKKKVIIDLRLSTSDAIELLSKDINDELKDYIIEKRINDNDAIKNCISSSELSDLVKEKIILRKINMGNIFSITRYSFGDVRALVYDLKDREMEDFIDSLTVDSVLSVINTYDTPIEFVERIMNKRMSLIKDAINTCSKKDISSTMRFERNQILVDLVVENRNDDLYEIIRELSPNVLLTWLNKRHIPEDIKDYIIKCHSDALDKEINKMTASKADFYYLNERAHLPDSIKRRIFDVCKDEFVKKFMDYSQRDVINKIRYGGYDDLLRGLLVELRVDQENIVELLEDKYIGDHIIDTIFEKKGYIFEEMLLDRELDELLTLSGYNFSEIIKNRILDLSKDLVGRRLSDIDKDTLYEYLKKDDVLVSAKRRILERFGIYEDDLHNTLEILDIENIGLLLDNYSDIREFIKIVGIDFKSFIQYGSGSKKYDKWLVNLTKIIKDGKIDEFVKVKNYFFSNYYSEYLDKENAVYTISSFLELLDNYSRYSALCVNLANHNLVLSNFDKLNIEFLFNITEVDGLDVPKSLEELAEYKKKLYEDIVLKINSGDISDRELKQIFNDLVFGHADEILASIGGTGTLRTLKKDNANSLEIVELTDELMLYSKIIEMVNDTNNTLGLKKLLEHVFSDIDTLTRFQNLFSQFEKKVVKLYEADSRNNLTSLEKARYGDGVIDQILSGEYGGEVFNFSDKNYVLYAHVISRVEDIEALLDGRASGKSNFISVSPISYKGQKYYWDRSECIFAFDKIPRGSFVCSSIHNMGTNSRVSKNSSEVEKFSRMQRGILETSAVTLNNSEALLYREGLRPCGLILPGGRKPTERELAYHEKYNLPFIITQDIMRPINNPKMIFNGNGERYLKSSEDVSYLNDIIEILSSNVNMNKETDEYTGREVALFTDSHSMYEPTLAVLEDIRRHGITEIYSLGDNVGLGPNPREVFDLMEEYGVISVAGNSEYYCTLGVNPFPYFDTEKEKSRDWTVNKLGSERIKKLEIYPASIDLMLGDKKLALCHFANDVRWDFRDRNVGSYIDNFRFGENCRQFEFTNSDDSKKKVNDCITSLKKGDERARGYVSSREEPLFGGKCVTDYDAIIQGHSHFDLTDRLDETDIYTLRAVGMGYGDDVGDSACYYVLKEKKDGNFEVERRLVKFNKNSLLSNIHTSGVPDKNHVLSYVMTDMEKRLGY